MKKFKWIFIFTFAIFCVNCSAQTTAQNEVFVFSHNFIGAIANNKVQFYEYDDYDNLWMYLPEADLTLPDGYKNIFVLDILGDGAIGVVTNNRLQIYGYDRNSWIHVPELDLTLPGGYSGSVFTFGDSGVPNIGVVAGSKVQFYEYDNSWVVKPTMELTLPTDIDAVFCSEEDENIVGVVADNKFHVYKYDNSWTLIPELKELTLPDGYKNVFGFLSSGEGFIGVAANNKVQFYGYGEDFGNSSSWTLIPELELTLPDGYRNVFDILGNNWYIGIVVGNKLQFYGGGGNDTWAIIPEMELVINAENQNKEEGRNNTPKISSGKEGVDWSFQDMLEYLRSNIPDFSYDNTDFGAYFGPAVYFQWSDDSRVYVQARTGTAEARNAADQAMLEGEYAFSWGRFYFASRYKANIDFLKNYFPQ